MAVRAKAIVINPKDNVATALEALPKGTSVSIEIKGTPLTISITSEIPMGHKFALQDMEKGEAVVKYGEPIGYGASRIRQGEHVHVHNVTNQGAERDSHVF